MTRLLVFCFALLSLSPVASGPIGQEQKGASVTTVVQMSYYAQPGKEKDVLNNRLEACAVLERNGVTRGRVMSRTNSPRATRNADDPDVVWEGEFPDLASLKRYEEVADTSPDFGAARQKMGTLTRKTERRYFEVR